MRKAEGTLEKIESTDVKLRLNIAQIRLKFKGDEKGEAGGSLWKILERYLGPAAKLPTKEESFIIAFDRGDVYWLRGYCHLLMAMTDLILATDWKKPFEHTGHLVFTKVESPYKFLSEFWGAKEETLAASGGIVDAITFIHLLSLPVVEPDRTKSALKHLETMIDLSRKSWKAIESETDDDHEWIPNPRQTGVIPGVRVTQEMITGWYQFLDEAEAILAGKKLVPHWRITDGRGINLRRLFTEPQRFDLVLWVQGTAAQPYLERGELTTPEFWNRLQRIFGGEFIGFALWFN
jgi:hypothetical protein